MIGNQASEKKLLKRVTFIWFPATGFINGALKLSLYLFIKASLTERKQTTKVEVVERVKLVSSIAQQLECWPMKGQRQSTGSRYSRFESHPEHHFFHSSMSISGGSKLKSKVYLTNIGPSYGPQQKLMETQTSKSLEREVHLWFPARFFINGTFKIL